MLAMSDEEILKLSYSKPSYFGEIYDRHSKRFMAIAKKTLRSGDDAEDVVQEAFVKIYKYGKKFSASNGKFRPWANTILKNCLADQINKYKNVTVEMSEEIENTAADWNQYDYNYGNTGYYQFVLGKIDKAAAEIINLRYNLGKSFKEIAKILNIKNSTARVRVHRSKKMFMEAYEQYSKYE
jgi:RNA polymerase sigma factor (sigma-70 family)